MFVLCAFHYIYMTLRGGTKRDRTLALPGHWWRRRRSIVAVLGYLLVSFGLLIEWIDAKVLW